MRRLAVLVALTVLVTGCGSSRRAILYAGVQRGPVAVRISFSDAQAQAIGVKSFVAWKRALAVRAAQRPRQHFPNLPRAVFLSRLRQAAARDGFTVTTVQFYRPRQVAPYVRVQTRQYLRLSQTIRSLTKMLDPHRGTSDLAGYSYEGFFLEGDDERGVPFVIASTLTRGQVEGSQWARSDALYPFAHG